MDLDEATKVFREFVAIVKALRTPGTGCPWDLEQDHQTLRPYLIEEAYEVLDAMNSDDRAFREELGDLLLQVVLHAQVADDRGAFSITEVVRGIADKMVRRHPHVFGSVQVSGSDEVVRNWEKIKAAENQQKGADSSNASALERVPASLPALLRAERLGAKAAKVRGEDTPLSINLTKVRTEFDGLLAKLQSGQHPSALPDEQRLQLEQELGNVLFDLTQVARQVGLSAEGSLRACTNRFVEQLRRGTQE